MAAAERDRRRGRGGRLHGPADWFNLIAPARLLAGLEWFRYQRRWIS